MHNFQKDMHHATVIECVIFWITKTHKSSGTEGWTNRYVSLTLMKPKPTVVSACMAKEN